LLAASLGAVPVIQNRCENFNQIVWEGVNMEQIKSAEKKFCSRQSEIKLKFE